MPGFNPERRKNISEPEEDSFKESKKQEITKENAGRIFDDGQLQLILYLDKLEEAQKRAKLNKDMTPTPELRSILENIKYQAEKLKDLSEENEEIKAYLNKLSSGQRAIRMKRIEKSLPFGDLLQEPHFKEEKEEE